MAYLFVGDVQEQFTLGVEEQDSGDVGAVRGKSVVGAGLFAVVGVDHDKVLAQVRYFGAGGKLGFE